MIVKLSIGIGDNISLHREALRAHAIVPSEDPLGALIFKQDVLLDSRRGFDVQLLATRSRETEKVS